MKINVEKCFKLLNIAKWGLESVVLSSYTSRTGVFKTIVKCKKYFKDFWSCYKFKSSMDFLIILKINHYIFLGFL